MTRLHDEVYARLRHGRLVLIGGPGAGKTGAMILLLLEALRYRDQVPEKDRTNVPVPLWLTLGSWNPIEQELREWVAATMRRDHPYLRAVDFGPDAIEQLFDTGRAALFLDGLDEMPDVLRGRAMQRLTTEAAGLRVVLTSRPNEYAGALDTGQHLPYTAVVELRPVSSRAAAKYLLEGQIGTARQAWQQVADHLQADPGGVLARTLNTPLMLSLARSTYTHADPAGLLAPELDTEQALRGHLLDQVLIIAYPDPRERAHATYWLGWIAHHMNTQPDGPTRDLSWWSIPDWIPSWRIRQALGLGFGIGAGLVVGLGVGLGFGIRVGLGVGLVVGLGFGIVGATIGTSGLGLGGRRCECEQTPQVLILRRPAVREVRLLLGPLWALLAALVEELLAVWSVPLTTSPDTTPRSTHRQDVRTRFVVGLVAGLGFGFVGGLRFGLAGVFACGFAGGLAVELVGFRRGSSPQLLVAELVLLIAGGRRVRFMRVLEGALSRQVLRQAGAVYQFRHAELQDRLADRFEREHVRGTS